jgi:NAD(P)-dependent dehydrogenase (short-subunit alcohol dehydrogenase family)
MNARYNQDNTGDPFDLRGHVAVVTGAATGIGYGFSQGLVQAGATVALLGRTAAKLESASRQLSRSSAHGDSFPVVCDVADEEQVSAAMNHVVEQRGRIDSCFANAGVVGQWANCVDTSLDEFRRLTAIDLDGTFITLREAARHMIALGEGGSLVATSSIGAKFGMPRQYAYSASKGAVTSIVNSLAVELARHGIRVNAVVPGFVATALTESGLADDDVAAALLRRIPMRRFGASADFGGVAVYLASAASAYHTGDALVLDGGYSVY